ncbi:MAG: Peptidyl-prolyl cis-trans isomerase PpiD [Labilithrix sp.]|nr:Peptidyl-prolyl cis-trans isomerase PpiD [Labilithrix sp.]
MIGFAAVNVRAPSLVSPASAGAALVLALALALAGCKSCDSGAGGGGDDGGHAQATSLTPEQARQVLARVGDETITLGDYAAALEHMDQFDRLRYQSKERRKELLDEMITVKLLAKEAIAKGYDKDPVAQQEVRAILRDSMLAEARKNAPTPADVPEADVRAFFEAHRADYKDPERRRLSVIQLKDEASAKDALAAAKKAAGPAQWGELVRARSIDPQARANVPVDLAGDVGIVSPPGDPRGENTRVPEEVRVAAFAIPEVGAVGDGVVAAKGRFYVVRLTQKLAAHERTYEEAERSIRVKLAQDKLRAKEDELIADLRRTVKVEVDDAALATVKVDMGDGGGPASLVDGGATGASDAAR